MVEDASHDAIAASIADLGIWRSVIRHDLCENAARNTSTPRAPKMRSLFGALALLCACSLHAQSPYLVTDLNTSSTPNAVSSNPHSFASAGTTVLFSATGETGGGELYKTDGTTIELVKDIIPGAAGSSPASFVSLNSTTVVFSALGPDSGRELWKSDGTQNGTVLVKDIFPGGIGSQPAPVAALNGIVFLIASDNGSTQQVWVTDGTEPGTRKLIDASETRGFFAIGGFMYFHASNTLWRSDGTPEGTSVVRSGLSIRTIVAAGGRLFFAGWDSAHGYELWTSDGTPAGTYLLKDINPGASSAFNTSFAFSFATAGDAAVFFAYDPTNGWSLWRSDGTANGTVPFKSYPAWLPSVVPPFLQSAGGLAFFSAAGVWRTDGTDAGTIRLGNGTEPLRFVAAAPPTVFFFARSPAGAYRLWSTDGSDGGTRIVSPAVSVIATPSSAWMGGKLYFAGSDGVTGTEPWVSDGTEDGTRLIENMTGDPPASSNPDLLRGTTGRVFFTATDGAGPKELWVSDGSAGGTSELTNFAGSKEVYAPSGWKGNLFFTTFNNDLYFSDGTPAGTRLLKEAINQFTFASSGYFYFTAWNSNGSGRDLWRSDGTAEGTINISAAAAGRPVDAAHFIEMGGLVYFEAGSPRGLWRTDGTPASTVRLTTHPASYGSIGGMAGSTGNLYSSNTDALNGTELWVTDAIRGVTTVIDIRPGTASSFPQNLTAAGGLVFFTADVGTGRELWRSDGTRAGTFMLRDIGTEEFAAGPRLLTAVGNRLFFVAGNGLDGSELWTSDGTTNGTMPVADIAPGSMSSSPDSLVAADGLVWFSATDGATGRELWMSDGTAAGTARVADLNPGPSSSDPRSLAVGGRKLFFSAETSTGRELWAVPLNPIGYAIENARALETDGPPVNLRFKVLRYGDLSQPTTVAFATTNGTATAGADYTATSGVLAFASGMAEGYIDVAVTGDIEMESDELLFVTLSAPSSGVVENALATGVIEDNDRAASLALAFVQRSSYYESERVFVITNSGPSQADGVELRFTESPSVAQLSSQSCVQNGHGSVICAIGALLPGESRTVTIARSVSSGLRYDSANPPGYTFTAQVSTATAEADLTDNVLARMTSTDGAMLLPPFLVSSRPATLEYLRMPSSSQQVVRLSSSNANVLITPAEVTLPPNERYATFTVQPGSITGRTRLAIADFGPAMMVPIVAEGEVAMLDPIVISPSGSYWIKYGQNVEINARVAGRSVDGSYPTGVVNLLDENDTLIEQRAVDATGSVKFVRSNLPVGTYRHKLRYDGDSKFTALTVTLDQVVVEPFYTNLAVASPPVVCGDTVEVVVTVSTTETTQAPTGTITVTAGSTVREATLAATGANGVARATVQLPVTASTTEFYTSYTASGPFASRSQTYRSISVGCLSTISLQATATSQSRVVLTWTSSVAASTYEVYRYDTGFWSFRGYAGTTSYIDTSVSPGRAYLYRVRPTNSGWLYSAPDLAVTVVHSDDPLVAQVTPVRAAHFLELLAATNVARQLAGLSPAEFAIPPAAGAPITATPIIELRNAIAEARRLLGLSPVVLTDSSIPGTVIKALHMQELREAMK